MATLQKIRNQGGILVSIFIGLALVAFIVGDAFSSGSSIFNRNRNKVGEIAGESIDIQEFQNELMRNEEMIKISQQLPALNEEQSRMIRESTWEEMVSRRVLDQEFKALGMGISDDEMYDILLGDNMDSHLQQMFTNPNTGVVEKETAKNIVLQILALPNNSPDKQYWLFMENQIEARQRISKYTTLMNKALYQTKTGSQATLESMNTQSDISYLFKSYNTISDSAVTVSQNEIKEYYNSHQYLFKQEEARNLVYVNFDISASAEDIEDTRKAAEDLIPEFAEAGNAVEFANLSTEIRKNLSFLKRGELDNDEADQFIFDEKSEGVFGPYLDDNSYNLLRVAQRKMLPDSVKARHILLQPTGNNWEATQKLADSLANLIRKGGRFDELARQYSVDNNSAINGGDLGWFTPGDMVQPFSDSAFFAQKNEVKLAITQFGIHIIQVTDQTKPVEKVQLAIIAKEISPSQKTINLTYNEARKFAQNLNTYADFDAAVTEFNQTKRYATVGKNDYSIAGIQNAREIIRQAYLSKSAGKILKTRDEDPIFESENRYTVAVLTGIQAEGVSSLKDVTSRIERELRRKKKGEMLAKELKDAAANSQSLLSIAQKAGVEVQDASAVSFEAFQIPGAGIEPKVIAAIPGLTEGQISQPIIGNQGVYMVMVSSKETLPFAAEDVESFRNNQIQQNAYSIFTRGLSAVIEDAGMEDMRYKFY